MSQELTLKSKLEQSAEVLRARLGEKKPIIAIVLGTGLGPLADRIENAIHVPFSDIPHMNTSTTSSHVGRFVCGELGGKCVLAMQGRLHGYEGNTSYEVAYPIWLMNMIGAQVLITSNAAGAINPAYQPGDFCLVSDHINFTGRNPIVGKDPLEIAPRFFAMHTAYDPKLRALAVEVAQEQNVTVHEGVYLGLLGPSFETPAEIRAFARWGADTVAMSMVEEVIAARHVGMRVLGVNLCSNMAAGVGSEPDDDQIMVVARRAEHDFGNLVEGVIARLSEDDTRADSSSIHCV